MGVTDCATGVPSLFEPSQHGAPKGQGSVGPQRKAIAQKPRYTPYGKASEARGFRDHTQSAVNQSATASTRRQQDSAQNGTVRSGRPTVVMDIVVAQNESQNSERLGPITPSETMKSRVCVEAAEGAERKRLQKYQIHNPLTIKDLLAFISKSRRHNFKGLTISKTEMSDLDISNVGTEAPRSVPQKSAGALAQEATAQAVFDRDFPFGFSLIETSGDGLLCGFAAVIKSMDEMQKSLASLPVPTMEDLQSVLKSPVFMDLAREAGMSNSDQFTIDQVGGVLYYWGLDRGLNLRVGYVTEGDPPQLLSHANEDAAHIVWIYNDNFEASGPRGAIGHYSGMRRRISSNCDSNLVALAASSKPKVDQPIQSNGKELAGKSVVDGRRVDVNPYDQYPEIPAPYRFGDYQYPKETGLSNKAKEVSKDEQYPPAFWKKIIPKGREGSFCHPFFTRVSVNSAMAGFVTLEVLRETVDLGQDRYGIHVPACGKERTDVTSFLEAQQDWGWDAAHRPKILYRFEKTDFQDPTYRIQPLRDHQGRYVLNAARQMIKDFENMPLTISSKIEGWRIAAISREDSRISHSDVTDRILMKARHKGNTYQMRNRRDRLKAPAIAWTPRADSDIHDKHLASCLSAAQRHHNTTWGVPERTAKDIDKLSEQGPKRPKSSKTKGILSSLDGEQKLNEVEQAEENPMTVPPSNELLNKKRKRRPEVDLTLAAQAQGVTTGGNMIKVRLNADI
ncbi:MAG: hypothetical protein M1812_006759 [Candelaria pacifica]|nr:MAG: hypothetical protein M1812_006759 [Candelaria pacifica]